MIIMGWTSADLRGGHKVYAALWRNGAELAGDRNRVAEFKLDNMVLREFDDAMSLADAKVQVIESLKVKLRA